MKLRSAYSSITLGAVLIAASFLLVPSAAWAQSLTASANPPSGGAGLNSSYLTGSGFPAGAITGAAVHFAATCAAPAALNGPVTQVTTQGILRRFQFLIPASLTPGTYSVWVTGMAGTTAFNTLNNRSCSTIVVNAIVSGTASLGAAVNGGIVTLVDANGNLVSGVTASDGTFNLSSPGLTPPFLVRVVTTIPSGNFPAGTTLYSVSADGGVSTHINVDVLTDLMVRSYYSAQGLNLDTAFSAPTGPNAAPPPLAVQALAFLVLPTAELWFNSAGVNPTAGAPSGGAINLVSSPFIAYPPGVTPPAGLDAVLHNITSETVNLINGAVTVVTFTSGPITETIVPTYSGGLITLTATITNSSTGASSTQVTSGLAITSAQQSAVTGITTAFALFQNIVNSKGGAVTGTDLLPFYASDYLNDGNNAAQDAAGFAQDLAGITINSLQLLSLKSLDTVNNIADVIAAFTVSNSGGTQSGTQEWIFKLEGGVWALYGDRRVGQVFTNAESRTSQGSQSLGAGSILLSPGVRWQTDVFAGVNAPHGVVTGATVTGGGNIWGGGATGTLTQFAQQIQNGQAFDSFSTISGNLGNGVLNQTNKSFTFNLTTAAFGNQQATVLSNAAATTEVLKFAATFTPGTGTLASVLGTTVGYSWVLPTTYTISQVNLDATIYDGASNNPATLSCNIDSTGITGTASTSGSITFPLNMSACGLPASDTIKQIFVFLEVEGTHSEKNIVLLGYPY